MKKMGEKAPPPFFYSKLSYHILAQRSIYTLCSKLRGVSIKIEIFQYPPRGGGGGESVNIYYQNGNVSLLD